MEALLGWWLELRFVIMSVVRLPFTARERDNECIPGVFVLVGVLLDDALVVAGGLLLLPPPPGCPSPAVGSVGGIVVDVVSAVWVVVVVVEDVVVSPAQISRNARRASLAAPWSWHPAVVHVSI